jgi:phage recombination protein Bet
MEEQMNTQQLPAVTQSAALIDYSNPEMIKTLKATVAVGATDAEFAMFAGLAKSTGLNPFKREIWFIKTPGYRKKDGTTSEPKVQIMTGINGFLAIANSHPQYDGMECEVERDKFKKPARAVCKVYRKDRKFPAVAEAIWGEDSQDTMSYNGKPTVWGKIPGSMLAKVAKSRALREAFPQQLGGLHTEEEMPPEYSIELMGEAPEKYVPPSEHEGAKMLPDDKPEADTLPDEYRLQAPRSTHKGKTLIDIHKEDPKWIPFVLSDERRQGACTKRDMANLTEFWKVMKPKGGAGNGTPPTVVPAEDLKRLADDMEGVLNAMDEDGMFDIKESK